MRLFGLKRFGMTLAPLVVCGPSGSGKSTLLSRLMTEFGDCFQFAVSHTTRPARPTEQNGREYHFVSRETFDQMVANRAFVEWTRFSDNFYGTSEQSLREVMQSKRIPVLDVELSGVLALKQRVTSSKCVFITARDLQSLERQLRARSTEDAQSLERRLSRARQDMEWAASNGALFDLVIVNTDVETAFAALRAFVAEDVRRVRQKS